MSDNLRDVLAAMIPEVLPDLGSRVNDWPEDEQEAYRSADSFTEGLDAVWEIRYRKAAEAIIERLDLEEEWAVMAPDGGYMFDGPDAEKEAREAYARYHHETEILQRRYVTRYEDMES